MSVTWEIVKWLFRSAFKVGLIIVIIWLGWKVISKAIDGIKVEEEYRPSMQDTLRYKPKSNSSVDDGGIFVVPMIGGDGNSIDFIYY